MLFTTDPHGEYPRLRAALRAMDYDASLDALIVGGDLADRGPCSAEAVDFIKGENVHRVLGNHDEMPGMWLRREQDRETMVEWGCEWFLDMDDEEVRAIARAFADAPHAMTVSTPRGHRVGIVHADCMPSWDDHVEGLGGGGMWGRYARQLSLWKRDTIERVHELVTQGDLDGATRRATVRGIDHVLHGHTAMDRPLTVGNRTWLDTGACFGGALTVVDVDRCVSRGVGRRV